MPTSKTVLAICGSTRAQSSNLNLIKALAELAKGLFEVEIFTGLAELPHFNPDLDTEDPAPEITAFRNQLKAADGILICTPEYAMGVPGSLKNAIDWTVSSMEFHQKPTALITASSVGQKGHQALLETLMVIEAKMVEQSKLLIPFIKTKINAEGVITNAHTFNKVKTLIHAFSNLMESPAE